MTTKVYFWIRIFSLLFLSVLSITLIYFFIQRWDVGYSSDVALVYLAAKSIAFEGARPIFVGAAGYQGMFMEAYPMALLFKLFGSGPKIAAIVPSLYLFLATVLFFFFIKSAFDFWTAWASTFYFIVLSPWVYIHTTRSLPNFSSVLLLGILSFFLYQRWFEIETSKETPTRSDYGLVLAIGFVVGFGTYTFSLVNVFTVAILLHASLFFFLAKTPAERRRFINETLLPHSNINRGVLKFILAVIVGSTYLVLLLAILFFLTNTAEIRLGQSIIRVNAVNAILIPFLIIIFLNLALRGVQILRSSHLVISAGMFILGWAIGMSPEFYYYRILKGTGGKGLALGGTLETVLVRAKTMLLGHHPVLAVDAVSMPAGWVIVGALLVSIVIFLCALCFPLIKLARIKQISALDFTPGRFLFPLLALSMTFAFLSTNRIIDISSNRYLLPVTYFYALSLGFSLLWALRNQKLPRRIFFSVLLISSPILTAQGFRRTLTLPTSPIEFEIMDAMRSANLKYGISDYWFAFSTTFLSDGEVIIAPINSKHYPKFSEIVSGQPTIAYILPPDSPDRVGDTIHWNGRKYELAKKLAQQSRFTLWQLTTVPISFFK